MISFLEYLKIVEGVDLSIQALKKSLESLGVSVNLIQKNNVIELTKIVVPKESRYWFQSNETHY